MDWDLFVKIVGAITIAIYLYFGIDDLIWFIYSTIKSFMMPRDEDAVLDFNKLRACPPKLLAISIAAWHESNVIGNVLVNLLNTTDYPKSMYHIFVGVYPNDPETIESVEKVREMFPNVHAVINDLDGPTTKAQNINCVIRHIKEYEKAHGVRFASLTIHDSEDVVHTYELLTTNYLIDKHRALQFPVFPILKMPTFKNFFKQITTATYADEFAENHYVALVERKNVKAFVPCAGTGFALSRRLLDSFENDEVLPADALTEDYLLSLILYKKGINLQYVLNKLPRVRKNGKIRTDFISTRSLFPSTFKTAVKQKTRWTYGITMQSISMKDVFTREKISFAGRYSFYKDVKSKLVNLMPLFGYAVSVYCILAFFFRLTPLYEYGTPVYYMAVAVVILMMLRQAFRGYALYKVYGLRSVFFGCLFPPFFPIRLIYGNIINFVAASRAFKLKYFGTKKTVKKEAAKNFLRDKKVKWAKTDHEFLTRDQLRSYRRMLGDVLITQGFITPKAFKKALGEVDREHGEQIGSHLINEGIITKREFLRALGFVKHIVYVPSEIVGRLDYHDGLKDYEIRVLRKKLILPLAYENGTCMIGVCDKTTDDDMQEFADKHNCSYRRLYMIESDIVEALDDYISDRERETPLESMAMFRTGKLTYEQVILIGTYSERLGRSEKSIGKEMGFDWGNTSV